MAELKTQLEPVIEKLTSLNARMETLNTELKSLDEQHKAGVQIDSRRLQRQSKGLQCTARKQRALIAANRSDLQTYDDLLKTGFGSRGPVQRTSEVANPMNSKTIPAELPIAVEGACTLSLECWRLKGIAELVKEGNEGSGLRHAIRCITETLEEMGIEVVDFAGRVYDPGMVPEVVDVREDPEMPRRARNHRRNYCADGDVAWTGYRARTNYCEAFFRETAGIDRGG